MLMLISLSIVQSCRNNVTEPGPIPEPQAERGVFILNEGSFPNAGSVSFYNIKKDSVIQAVVNSSSGWITPNDARVVGTKLYVVVNGGNKVYVRDANTFQAIDSIAMPPNSSPGYIWIVDSTRAYVANYAGTVSLLNLTTRTVVQTSSTVVTFPGGIIVNSGRV
jgi:DNA-binding beta-propeller fold protein YncE